MVLLTRQKTVKVVVYDVVIESKYCIEYDMNPRHHTVNYYIVGVNLLITFHEIFFSLLDFNHLINFYDSEALSL